MDGFFIELLIIRAQIPIRVISDYSHDVFILWKDYIYKDIILLE